MKKTLRSYVLYSLLIVSTVACLIGLGIGLWSILDLSSGATLFVRGIIALIGLVLIVLIGALILLRKLSRSTTEIFESLQQLQKGNYSFDPPQSPFSEFSDLANEIRLLAVTLEEQKASDKKQVLLDTRHKLREATLRFGNGISREVQKSMAGVIGFIEMALRQPNVEGQLKDYLTLSDQEARSGRQTMDRILKIVRDDPFPTEALDLNTLVQESNRSFVNALERENIKIEMNLANELRHVIGDSGLIKQVISILINNARDAMLPDGGVLELSTNTDTQGRSVLTVKDSGRGIPDDCQYKIFTPFYTTKGNQKGAGLNLAISDAIIRRHNGELDFWSKEGQGSMFFMSLPTEGLGDGLK
jgi:signal transduction histidine kinase